MDIKHLRTGVKLLLPVGVEGALFSLGDTHAAQGDGEVCGTAIETAMDVILRLTVRRDFTIEAPQYHVPAGEVADAQAGYHVCTGVGPDLMEARATPCARRSPISASATGSTGRRPTRGYVAADLRIHEVVDVPNWVVGAFIPEAIFEGGR